MLGHKLLGPERGPLTGEREGEPVAPQLMTHAACIVASVRSFAPSFNLEAWFLDEAPREASLRGEEVALARVTLRARPCLCFASAALLVNFLCGGLAGAVRVCVCRPKAAPGSPCSQPGGGCYVPCSNCAFVRWRQSSLVLFSRPWAVAVLHATTSAPRGDQHGAEVASWAPAVTHVHKGATQWTLVRVGTTTKILL